MPAGSGTAKSKATKAAPDPNAALNAVLKAAEAKYGKGMIHKGSEHPPVYKLPFLQPNMNYATEGGLGFGRVASLYGESGTGKTRCAYEQMAQIQALPGSLEVWSLPRIAYHTERSNDPSLGDALRRLHEGQAAWLQEELDWVREEFPSGGDVAFYNAEQQYNERFAAEVGVDNDRVHIVDTTVIEEICDIAENLFQHIPMHVIDSTSYASSTLMLKQDVGKSLIAVDARQWKSSLKHALAFFDKKRNHLIMIHQMGTNVSTGGQRPNSTQFMRFASSCSVKFSRGKFLWMQDGVLKEDKPAGIDDESMAGRAEADGAEIFAQVEKSRTCRPFKVAGMQWSYARPVGYVAIHEYAQSGLYYGIIKQSGSWFSVDGEEKTVGQGLKSVYARLADDEELRGRIIARLLDYTVD